MKYRNSVLAVIVTVLFFVACTKKDPKADGIKLADIEKKQLMALKSGDMKKVQVYVDSFQIVLNEMQEKYKDDSMQYIEYKDSYLQEKQKFAPQTNQ